MASVMDDYGQENQQPILGRVYGALNSIKRGVKDAIRNPLDYLDLMAGNMQDQNREYDRGGVPALQDVRGVDYAPTVKNMERLAAEKLAQQKFREEKDLARGLDWLSGGAGVIKKAGGNWLKNEVKSGLADIGNFAPQVPGAVRTVERGVPQQLDVFTQGPPQLIDKRTWRDPEGAIIEQSEGQRGWMDNDLLLEAFRDKKLAPYVQNRMASFDDELRQAADAWPAQKALLQEQAQKRVDDLYAQGDAIAAKKGIPREYLTAHREKELKAEYELRLITERNALHQHTYPEPRPPNLVSDRVADQRFIANNTEMTMADTERIYPKEGVATSPAGKQWEDMADESIGITPAGEFQALWAERNRIGGTPHQTQVDNPWVAKLPPNTPTYHIPQPSGIGYDAGFSHMFDEAYNALDKGSDIPDFLRLTPEQFKSMGVADLSQHVAKIDAHRAALKTDANLARANNPATHNIRDYPDSSRGLAWKQIKPGAKQGGVPEGVEVVQVGDSWKYRLKEPDSGGSTHTSPPYSSEAEALASMQTSPYYQAHSVRDAIKYEGDALSHCVGGEGYCRKITEGSGEIFSLRDAKGNPYVTIETTPARTRAEVANKDEGMRVIRESMSDAERLEMRQYEGGPDEYLMKKYGPSEKIDESVTVHPFWSETVVPARIIQIKGKRNGRPPEDVQEAITDFIQNPPHGQPWGEVGDLSHTNMIEIGNNTLATKEQIMAAMEKLPDTVPNMGRTTAENFEKLKRHPSIIRGKLGQQIEQIIKEGK